jgi:hypothetical protein
MQRPGHTPFRKRKKVIPSEYSQKSRKEVENLK